MAGEPSKTEEQIAGRLWLPKPRYTYFYVSHLPGEEGKDWGYTTEVKKAKPLTPHYQRRFAAYCRKVNAKADFYPVAKEEK
jgi:hypothetical protein